MGLQDLVIATKTSFESRSRDHVPRVNVRGDNTLVVTCAPEALVHLVMLAEQLPGVGAMGVELLGLLALAIRASIDPLSAFVLPYQVRTGLENVSLTCTSSSARYSRSRAGSTEYCLTSSRGSCPCLTPARVL